MLELFTHQARPSANGPVGVLSLMAKTYLAITVGHSASRDPVTGEGDMLIPGCTIGHFLGSGQK